jgi:hypothetical protein
MNYTQASLFDAPPREAPVRSDHVTAPNATDLPFGMDRRLILAGWHWLHAARCGDGWLHTIGNLRARAEKRTLALAQLYALLVPAEAARLGFHVRPVDDCFLLWRDDEDPDQLLPLDLRDAYWFLAGEQEQPHA